MVELVALAAAVGAGTGASALGASTLGALGTGVLVGGQLLQGIQGFQQAKAQSKILKQQAASERKSAEFEAAQQRKQTKRLLAKQITQFSKSGVRVTGSALDVIAATAAERELEALAIQFGGEVRGTAAESQAALESQRAGQELLGGAIGAGATFLTSSAIPRKGEKKVRFR